MKQPIAITPIFFTEMWERFGYYVIQGLLVLYLIYQLNFSDTQAFVTLGEFISWIYIAPIFGGLLADRVLGYRYSILCGAILLCAGYLLLAYAGELFLHLSLSIIIVGNGLLKPNGASFLGKFYYHDDPRRYPGFTFFYIGINVGGLLSIFLSSFAILYIGFHTAFALAGFGMLIGVVVFFYGFRYFENRGLPVNRELIKPPFLAILSNRFILILILCIVILTLHYLLHQNDLSQIILLIVAFTVFFSLFYIQRSYSQTTRNKLIAVIILIAASVIFWAEQLQIFFSIILYTDRLIDRTFFGFQIPAPLFLILEPLFILIIGPIFANIWKYQSEKRSSLSPPIKFSLGLLAVGCAMSILAFSTYLAPHLALVNPIWLVCFYLLLAIGELLIMPTGLAMITELAPPKMTGFMMGVWYMVLGLGGLLAEVFARLIIHAPSVELHHHILGPFSRAFSIYAIVALFVGLVLFLISPKLNQLIDGHS